MPRKSQKTPEQIFEEIYQKYYVNLIQKIHNDLKEGKKIYPSPDEQQQIINDARKSKCNFGLIENLLEDKITRLFVDEKFPFNNHIDNKTFFKCIHPSYFLPYLTYASFGYELASLVNQPAKEILTNEYQISLPLKLENQSSYTWYIQKARPLTLNEHNQVISHINTYHIEREFLPSVDKEIRFIGATVLQDEKINEAFQERLKTMLTEHFKKHVFNDKQWEVIKYQTREIKKTEHSQTTISEQNKLIKKKMELHTGYKFDNIYDIIDYLRCIKVLE